MYCGQCGKEIPEGNAFCEFCGAPVETPEPPQKLSQRGQQIVVL